MPKRKIHRILVVDDDPVMIKLVEGVLVDKGYDVTFAREAAEGLQIAMNEVPDLVILDVMMPVINGFNFCKLIKSEKKTAGVPIVLVTSRSEQEDIHIGMEVGADAYLCKPVNTQELLKVIQVVEHNLNTD